MLVKLIQKYIQEGEARGEAKGRAEGEAKALKYIINNMLAARFGNIPAKWQDIIDNLQDAAAFGKLSNAIYRVKDAEEFDALLKSGSGAK